MKKDDNNYVKSGEAARYLGVSIQTLRNWQYRNILDPEQIYPSGHRRYSKKQLEELHKDQECL